jgi:uncharacterized protein (DUF362 family)/Pyruvate/2-oxoacid:ferredoxin oxidoreductase delta subunit
MNVLIKPNFLIPATPDMGIITHPMIVRSVAQYVLERGAAVQISDSPALGSLSRVARVGGYAECFDKMKVRFKEFQNTVPADIGPPYGKIRIAEDALRADMVINVPKLKTHAQMMLTLGVKNLFGCVVGAEKPGWHLRSGVDLGMFSRLLVQIHQKVRPAITLVDGILSLEGQGPGKSGDPRRLNVIVAGKNAHAVDQAICVFLGGSLKRFPTWCAAREMGLLKDNVDVDGAVSAVREFKFPVPGDLVAGPKPLQKWIRKHFLQRPSADEAACRLCMACRNTCPARAITLGERAMRFDYDKCIRCYCCLEICPEGAIHAVQPIAGRVFRKLRSFHGHLRNDRIST